MIADFRSSFSTSCGSMGYPSGLHYRGRFGEGYPGAGDAVTGA